jgi:hypothetical protein
METNLFKIGVRNKRINTCFTDMIHGAIFAERFTKKPMKLTISAFCALVFVFIVSYRATNEKTASGDKNTYSSIEDTLYLPFDTARVLALYTIPTKVDQIDVLKHEVIPDLDPEWDTLEVEYQMIACDCPNWYDVTLAPDEPTSEMSPSYAYYIEPASPDLKLFQGFRYCRVRLIGKHYKQQGWPENPDFMDPHPPLGNVFRYYAYELVYPAVIWGPLYHTGELDRPSKTEELIMATNLILQKK